MIATEIWLILFKLVLLFPLCLFSFVSSYSSIGLLEIQVKSPYVQQMQDFIPRSNLKTVLLAQFIGTVHSDKGWSPRIRLMISWKSISIVNHPCALNPLSLRAVPYNKGHYDTRKASSSRLKIDGWSECAFSFQLLR